MTIAEYARIVAQRNTPPAPAPSTLWAVGDIARCGGDHAAVAALIHDQPGLFLALGDQIQGTDPDSEYPNCYAPVFGPELPRTRPTPGNHEYWGGRPPTAYLSYFGSLATPNGTTWYSYDVGNWHVVSLNSNCTEAGVGCDVNSAQYQWLAADLAASTTPCLIAYWHHAPFDSQTGWPGAPALTPMLVLLQSQGLDVLLSGHVHTYERFARLDATGRPAASGFRPFVVGTGGASHHPHGTVLAGSEVRNDDTFGALRLDLRPDGYSWQFLPVAGRTFTDAGSDSC